MRIVCITNRHLVTGNYWEQLEKILAAGVQAMILREKDLSPAAYATYAAKFLPLCEHYHTKCILHSFSQGAKDMGAQNFHCSLPYLEAHPNLKETFTVLGVSLHTAAEAKKATSLGATYLLVGHIFPTSCKPDTQPVGLNTLAEICQSTELPVYALGGITPTTIGKLQGLPLAGVAVMSGLMTCENPQAYIHKLLK
jgi:thiamine-phosphate diphosphorylase